MISTRRHEELGLPSGATVSRPPVSGGIVGSVISFEHKMKTISARPPEPVMVLRLRSYTPEGSEIAPLVVELRGEEIDDEIAVGDWVQLPPPWTPGTVLTTVDNLTTGAKVELHRDSRLALVGALVTLLAAALVIGWFAANAVGL